MREIWILPRSLSPIIAGQLDWVGPAEAEDRIPVLQFVASELLLLEQCDDTSTVGRAGFRVVGLELCFAKCIVKTMAVTTSWHLRTAPHDIAHKQSPGPSCKEDNKR